MQQISYISDNGTTKIDQSALLEYLIEIKEYIESSEEAADGEWGSCRNVEELVREGQMPSEWEVTKELIEELSS